MWSHPFFVVNPVSGAGGAIALFKALEGPLKEKYPNMEYALTEGSMHAMNLVIEAASNKNIDLLGVFGGDGTLNEVVCGLMQSEHRPTLAVFPGGTGGDFRRVVGIVRNTKFLVEYLEKGQSVPIDVGLLHYLDRPGESRYFLNIASLGISGLVDRYVNSTTKVFGGKVSFIVGTLRGIYRYKNLEMDVTVDGQTFYQGPAALVVTANGRFFGGGMMIAPHAVVDDGLLDVVVLGDFSKLEFIGLSRFIYSGRHIGHKKCTHCRGRVVIVRVAGEALVDIDGEQVGSAPVRVEVIGGALRVLVPQKHAMPGAFRSAR